MSTQRTILSTAWRFVLLGLAGLVAACSQGSPDMLLASAKEYVAKGDRKAAAIQLRSLLQQAPNNGEARLLLGQVLLDTDDLVSAEKELSRALELKQPHERVLPPYAQSLLAQGKFDAVVGLVEKYRLFDPNAVAITQTALGDAYRHKGNAARAREAYASAIAAVPAYSRARLGEAILVAGEGKLEEALKLTQEVIASDSRLADAHTFKADILLAQGDRTGAKKSLEEAIAVNNRFMPARYALISMLLDEKAHEQVGTLIAATKKIAPGDLRISYFDALLAYGKGDLDAARQHIQQVLKFLPDHLPSLALAGALDLQANQLVSAEDRLRRVVNRSPQHIAARQSLIQTYLRMGQPTKARDVLQPLLEGGMPQDGQVLLLAGETYLANGDVKQASEFYRVAAAAGRSQGVEARTRLGQIALARGRADEGFKELEAASELDSGQYQADLAIITGHLRRNEFDKAMVAVQALEKKQPKNPLTFQLYGVVHLAKKDVAAARRNFEKALELQPSYLPAAANLATLDLLARRPEDARKRYEELIAKDDRNEQLYMALAELQVKTGVDIRTVAETLQRGINANPRSVDARVALINFHLGNKDAKAALNAAQSAVAAMPGEPQVLGLLATAQEAAGEANQAIETYNKMAALQPQAGQPLIRLASLFVRQGQTDRAIEALRRAQKVVPRDQNLVPQIVQAYLAGNRPDDALKESRELQRLQPKLAIGYALEGEVHLKKGSLDEAERAFREALKAEPKADFVAVRLHGVLQSAGKEGEANALAKKWIAENPKNAIMRIYLAERELAAKNLKASSAHYQAVLAIEPDNAMALNNLAWIGGELGDRKALEYAERALKLAPNSASVLDTYAMLLLRNGDVSKALAASERARTLEPNRIDLRLNHAKVLIKANRKDDARKELTELAKIKDQFAGKEEVDALLKSL